MTQYPSSDVILSRLMGLHPKVIDLSLGRTEDLLAKLGNPQNRLPPVVHVAGTNGKGSVVANLRAIAEAAGLRVHCYTSPHLVRFHERVRLAGELISEDALADLLEFCERANGDRPITFFEITTCAAFKAFAETSADILLLETGLGGRLDSTNVVERPAATVITPISMDHMQFLGDSLPVIAAEKAAIQKCGVPSIIAPQHPDALAVLGEASKSANADRFWCGEHWSYEATDEGGITFQSEEWSGSVPKLGLGGAHQRVNAAVALATALKLRQSGIELPDAAFRAGLARTEWPARLQRLTGGPAAEALPGWELWLDGGHNQAAGDVLAAEAMRWRDRDMRETGTVKPLHLICGMLNSKAADQFLSPLANVADSLTALAIPGEENAIPAAELAGTAATVGHHANPAASLREAIAALSTRPPGRLLICGSLYLAGRVLKDHR